MGGGKATNGNVFLCGCTLPLVSDSFSGSAPDSPERELTRLSLSSIIEQNRITRKPNLSFRFVVFAEAKRSNDSRISLEATARGASHQPVKTFPRILSIRAIAERAIKMDKPQFIDCVPRSSGVGRAAKPQNMQ